MNWTKDLLPQREATMGALIQTKGTQRLVKLFNDRFSSLNATRAWKNKMGAAVPNAFRSGTLCQISDAFIADNADPANWPIDMNDLFYPSATLAVVSGANDTLIFKPPGTQPTAIAQGAAVACINKPNRIEKKTKVKSAVLNAGILTVTLTKQILSNPAAGELISFATKKGNHERLVRRWRWYLQNDLVPQNNDAIRQAISTALDNDDFYVSVLFQTVEDIQKVIAAPQSKLDNDDESTDDLVMSILLMTQETTAPDKLDPQ
jgi:hypothetical protein